MTLREQTEALEREMLSPFACLSSQSRGRQTPLEPCPTRTCFQRDIDRIIHSKAFRRLKHKTQVFLEPEGDHYRTRMTHTIEVSRIARTIARGLRLNEDLAEAAAYGHDLGHTPFGHAGERVLNEILPGGFAHNEQSLRVVDRLEKEGEGLNLTYEVRRGILCHTGPDRAETLEGQLLRLADKIAYINHDIDDAIRGRIIYPMDIPLSISQVLGFTHSERINTLTVDIITQSAGTGRNPPVPRLPGGHGTSCGSSCSSLSTATRWPRGRRARPRRCSAACLTTIGGTRTSCPRSSRTSGWRRAWSGPSATTSPA